ncbi:MAG: winged helix-turn-helix transcriptional regulator [Bacteroidia bacterium]|nr:winged helix-turn-helix transcriptional regulator [Bacteroidia bacterium]
MNQRFLSFPFLAFFLLLCLTLSGQTQQDLEASRILVAMRRVGDEVLRASGDSTSRVLPVTRELNRYRISFATEFEFNPEDLVATINHIMIETKVADGFLVEVQQCGSGDVVYSYEITNLDTSTVGHCKSRALPVDCYQILITPWQNPTSPAILPAPSSPASSGIWMLGIGLGLLLVLLLAFFRFFPKKKSVKPVPGPHVISLGEYLFDKRNMTLTLGNESIELSSKEADLLTLLHTSANNTLERETILKVVWGDAGDYVGRTLDVFISKLRKKLQADASIKIVNVRGIGYKLVLNGEE